MDCDGHSAKVINVVCLTVVMSRVCSSKYKGVCPLSKSRN